MAFLHIRASAPRFLRAAAVLFALSSLAAAAEMRSSGAPQRGSEASGGRDSAVIALSFADFFKRPVGAYGLEPSQALLAADGARVRIAGYMVHEEAPVPGVFLLAPLPVALSDVEDGPADDLPPAVVFVHLQGADARALVQFQKAPMSLTGVLQVGNRDEANGRVSAVRLMLDPPSSDAAVPTRTRGTKRP